jgi:hypothetical protein
MKTSIVTHAVAFTAGSFATIGIMAVMSARQLIDRWEEAHFDDWEGDEDDEDQLVTEFFEKATHTFVVDGRQKTVEMDKNGVWLKTALEEE